MPIPPLTGLPPKAEYADIVRKVNQLVNELVNTLLNLDSLNVVSLTADHIDAGTINGNVVTIRSDLNGGAYIVIDGTGMTVSDGTQTTLHIDTDGNITMIGTLNASQINGSTITGSLFQTSAPGTYPRAEMRSSDEMFEAMSDADQFIRIIASALGSPSFVLGDVNYGAGSITYSLDISGSKRVTISCSDGINIDSGNNPIDLVTGLSAVRIQDWNSLVARSPSGQTLQAALNAKANTFTGYTGSFSTGTQTVTVSNGIITNVV
jgi:hypothetical protein